MGGIYDSVLKAYNELKVDKKTGMRLGYVILENEKVRVDAWFDKDGAMNSINVGARGIRDCVLEKTMSKYGGRNVTFVMQKRPRKDDVFKDHRVWEDIFRIKVKQGGLFYDTIDAELPEEMNKDEANALTEVLDVLGIGHGSKESGGRRPSVNRIRKHRELPPYAVIKALDVMGSRQHYHHYVHLAGNDESVHAGEGNVIVGMGFGRKTRECEKERKIGELQSLMERDPACRCDGLEVTFKLYKITS